MKFTNNDLAEKMGIEVDDIIVVSNTHSPYVCSKYTVVNKDGVIMLHSKFKTIDRWFYMSMLIDMEWHKAKPTPKLTELEITILKGRQEEGAKSISKTADGNFVCWNGDLGSIIWKRSLFTFMAVGKKYSISELLKGNEQ